MQMKSSMHHTSSHQLFFEMMLNYPFNKMSVECWMFSLGDISLNYLNYWTKRLLFVTVENL